MIYVSAFAIIGVTVLAISLAASPTLTTTEQLFSTYKQTDFEKLTGQKLNNQTSKFHQAKAHPFTIQYPSSWSLYRLSAANIPGANDTVLLRLLAPDTSLSGETHSEESIVKNGALIEVAAYSNSQYPNINALIKALGDSVVNKKNLTVAATPAAQYQLSSELSDDEDSGKIITSFFKNSVQYTISITPSGDSTKYMDVYRQIVTSFKIGQ